MLLSIIRVQNTKEGGKSDSDSFLPMEIKEGVKQGA